MPDGESQLFADDTVTYAHAGAKWLATAKLTILILCQRTNIKFRSETACITTSF